jgi:hypothetical protein
MLNIKQLTMQLELSFWSLAIRLLSESRLLRSALPYIYGLFSRSKFQPGLRIIVACSLSGFLVGLILGVLSII